jgi:hypothetical protein
MPQEPQIIELDPEGAPRLMAFILLACGLLGVGFLLVNVIFTGDDQDYIQSQWEDGTEEVRQRYDVIPSIVRGKPSADEQEEDDPETDEKIAVLKKKQEEKRKPGQSNNPFLPKPPTLPGQTTPGGPITPGAPPASPSGTPSTPAPPK